VGAFIAEPVMGTGGVIVPPPGYYQIIRDICDKYNVLFIADEVINAFGRTGGCLFGIEHWQGVTPDIMTIAKGITSGYVPLGAAVISDEIFQVIRSKEKFFHGFTYSAHALACRVGLKNIEIIERENLKDNSKRMGERLIAGLSALNLAPIGEVRGKGLMVGIDLVSSRSIREKYQTSLAVRVVEIAYEYGLISRPLNGDIVQLSPALIISEAEVDKIVEILGEAINKAYREKELIG
jgi:putrescine aminotransferase